MTPEKKEQLDELARKALAELAIADGLQERALEHARKVGEYLNQAKALIKGEPEGSWGQWFDSMAGKRRRNLTDYMKIARKWPFLQNASPPPTTIDSARKLVVGASRRNKEEAANSAKLRRRIAKLWKDVTTFDPETVEQLRRKTQLLEGMYRLLDSDDLSAEVGCVESHFLDSGAFSLKKNPLEFWYSVDCFRYMDRYAAFVKQYKTGIDYYANLDVIGNPVLTRRNQEYLEIRHGLKPVPAVHFPNDPALLQEYMDRGYEFISLGGMASKDGDKECDQWIEKCFGIVGRPPKVRIHSFGRLEANLLRKYPWWSADACSWHDYALSKKRTMIFPSLKENGWDVFNPMLIHLARPMEEKNKELATRWLSRYRIPLGRKNDQEEIEELGAMTHLAYLMRANLRYYEMLERVLEKEGNPVRIYYSGGGAKYANPEEVLGDEAKIMLSFKDMPQNGSVTPRFRKILKKRNESN